MNKLKLICLRLIYPYYASNIPHPTSHVVTLLMFVGVFKMLLGYCVFVVQCIKEVTKSGPRLLASQSLSSEGDCMGVTGVVRGYTD